MDKIDWGQLAKDEWRQRLEEGYDLGERDAPTDIVGPHGFKRFVDTLSSAAMRSDYPYDEPSDLEGIRALRRSAEHRYALSAVRDELDQRILGGWYGRAAGCLLGKPVEGWDHTRIVRYLEAAGLGRLEDYLPELEDPPEGLAIPSPAKEWLRGRIRAMPRDDDLDYTILGLHVLEERGREFTSADIADAWLSTLPYGRVYTAERVAYRNLVNGLDVTESALVANPYREWIGAQIRGDIWGYVNPGNPSLAAEMAWRDARISHTKNGIYGEMFVAASIAASFVAHDPLEAILIGWGEIPDSSRMAEAIRFCVDAHKAGRSWQEALESVRTRYGSYHSVHAINNACLVVLALLYGEGDFTRTIGLAVLGGWDTDCNGATAGSILGVYLGKQEIPGHWVDPLNDTIHSFVLGFDGASISDLARRTAAWVWEEERKQ